MAIETNELIDIQTLPPFKKFIMSIGAIPTSYLESMSYAELLAWFCNYLQNTVIPTVNNNGEAVEELQDLFVELKEYVDDYFDNLDVQNEINRKLDKMAENGQLQYLLSQQYNELESEVDEKLEILNNGITTRLDQQDILINNATSGSPLVASSTAGMTDTTRVYVNTTDGKWYYYNGSAWTIGGTYQGTTVASNDPTIVELDARLDQYMNYYYFNENATFNTPFEVKTGQKVYLKITAISTNTNVYTAGYTSTVYKVLTTTGTWEITATNTGPLRFNLLNTGNIQGYCYIENKLSDQDNKIDTLLYNYIPNVTSFNDIQLKKKRIYSNFSGLTNHSYGPMSGATIETVANYESTSGAALPTPVIRVRDNIGNLIYDIDFSDPTAIHSGNNATGMWTFDKNGVFLRSITFYNLTLRNNLIADDEYYAILNRYPTTAGYTNIDWIVKTINIDWLNPKEESVYHVGTGKDFDTFTEMLIALQDDSTEKTIYIDPGEYDIFEEMGGANYMTSLIDTASTLNWRDVCYVVPENTKIIGIGDVTLKWIATAEQMHTQDIAFLFSPLNVSGNCYIENINVVGQNCRYALHDETSGLSKYNGAEHTYKNCSFKYLPSTYGTVFAYGAGHNKGMKLTFDNCKFTSDGTCMWSTHDWSAGVNENSTFVFNNCIFDRIDNSLTNGEIRFLSSDTVGRKDKVQFNNCYMNSKIMLTTGESGNVRQGYDLTLIGSTNVNIEYSDKVTTRYTVKQYNSFN